MVELLVVITIISILAAIVTVASVGFVGQARVAATRTTIKKVDEAILERINAVNRYHMRPMSRLRHDIYTVKGWGRQWQLMGLTSGAGTTGFEEAELVLSRKGTLRELLPMSVLELSEAYWFSAQFDSDAARTAFLADMDLDSSNGAQSLDTPGEIFLYALMNAPVFGAQRLEEDAFAANELIDGYSLPDGTVVEPDGVYEIGDAWGRPLFFYRWPTRLVNDRDPATRDWGDKALREMLMPNAPKLNAGQDGVEGTADDGGDLKADPDDRAGYFSVNTAIRAAFETHLHDADTWHAPLVVSAGLDGLLGLRRPDDVNKMSSPQIRGDLAQIPRGTERAAALEALYDNITNHNSDGGF